MASEMLDFDEFPADAVWIQQPDEPNTAYAAFCGYRDMGVRRSLRRAAQVYYELDEIPDRLSGKVSQMSVWSSTYDWVERAWAFTQHQDRLARIEAAESAKEMVRRHAAIATLALTKGTEALRGLTPSELGARDVAALLDLGVKVERMARGQATEITVDAGEADATASTFREAVASDPDLALAARRVSLAMSGTPGQVSTFETMTPEEAEAILTEPESDAPSPESPDE